VVLNRPEGTGLGFNIIGGEGDTGIFISFISPGSISDKSGKLVPGDMILEVNGENVQEMTHEEAAGCLKGAGITVSLLVEYQPKEFKEFQQKLQKLQVLYRAVQPHGGHLLESPAI